MKRPSEVGRGFGGRRGGVPREVGGRNVVNEASIRDAGDRTDRPPQVNDALALAATPIFAAMTAIGSGSRDVICSAVHGSQLLGMPTMYVLMSAVHLGPWLRLMERRGRKSRAEAARSSG